MNQLQILILAIPKLSKVKKNSLSLWWSCIYGHLPIFRQTTISSLIVHWYAHDRWLIYYTCLMIDIPILSIIDNWCQEIPSTWSMSSSRIKRGPRKIHEDSLCRGSRVSSGKAFHFQVEKPIHIYPLVMTNIAMENDPVETVSFPITYWWTNFRPSWHRSNPSQLLEVSRPIC